MTPAVSDGTSSYMRWACLAMIVFLFALPCVTGRLTTYFVLLFGIFALLSPSVVAAFQARSRNPIDLMFVTAAVLPAIAFLFTSEDPGDLLFAFNFVPLLLALPMRWQLQRFARLDSAVMIGRLALAGAGIAVIVSVVQVLILGYERAGPPLMSAFHFADTAMLLGFVALVGAFAPGANRRWLYLLGPVLGILAALLSGTRGALIAAPVLGFIALAFALALAPARHRTTTLVVAAAVAVAAAVLVFAAAKLGFGRAVDGFSVTQDVIAGGAVDQSTRERLIMLWGGYQAFLHAPVFGYGWPDMVPAILPYVPKSEVERMLTFRQLHNGLLSFAVGAGIPGVISFLILSVAPVIAVLKTPRDELFMSRLYLSVTLCAAYAVFQLTIIMIGFEFHTVQYAFMTVVMLGFVQAPLRSTTPARPVGGKSSIASETPGTA
ncbi:O-antigen ligase family protein [Devosia sp. A16]|uniref:O-antigen ligase family protein n=1 Tax=Devosia sp. A16 TaxID=1736675 RepID=UPI0006D84735|nr:O-antigen ligase family protein [Devosia sp. A16]